MSTGTPINTKGRKDKWLPKQHRHHHRTINYEFYALTLSFVPSLPIGSKSASSYAPRLEDELIPFYYFVFVGVSFFAPRWIVKICTSARKTTNERPFSRSQLADIGVRSWGVIMSIKMFIYAWAVKLSTNMMPDGV